MINENKEIKPSKNLEVIWEEDKDNFIFDFTEICEFSKTLHATKRNVLKVLAMFYEPIGVLQLFLINLKSFFQQQKMTNQNPDNLLEHIELHSFSDASLQNYGTCLYLHLIYF